MEEKIAIVIPAISAASSGRHWILLSYRLVEVLLFT